MRSIRFLTPIALLLLSACVAPQTNRPGVTQEELAREQQIQQQFANEEALRRQENRTETRLQMEQRLHRVFAPIARAGATVCTQIRAQNRCVFQAELSNPQDSDADDDVKGVNAYADGDKIVVNPAMMRFARDDGELSFVLSHELAHNILEHPESTMTNALAGGILGTLLDVAAASQGYNTQGAFGNIGQQAGVLTYSQDFESEADYVGLYILANAGRDYNSAANFWRRMSARDQRAIYTSTTHPSNPERFVAMQKTAQEIAYKRQQRQPLLPEFRKN